MKKIMLFIAIVIVFIILSDCCALPAGGSNRRDNHRRDNHRRDNHHRDNHHRDNHHRDNHHR